MTALETILLAALVRVRDEAKTDEPAMWEQVANAIRLGEEKKERERIETALNVPIPEPLAEEKGVALICPLATCRRELIVPASARGKLIRCKECQTMFRVPEKK